MQLLSDNQFIKFFSRISQITCFHKVYKACGLQVLGVMLLVSCNSNPLDIDVSEVDLKLKVHRWDQHLFQSKDFKATVKQMKQTSEEMFAYYMELIQIDYRTDEAAAQGLSLFTTDKYIQEVQAEIRKNYASIDDIASEIEDAFKHVKYYYPATASPRLITYNGAFRYNVITTKSEIGLALETYLGPENRVVQKLPEKEFPLFLKKRMKKEFIGVDVMRSWAETNLLQEDKREDLLDHLIYEGKLLYFMDAVFPGKKDNEKIRYTPEQMAWCENYEMDIWKKIIANEWLYSTEELMITQFIQESPFTGTLPQSSPPRAGAWLGWKMVRSYMDAHPELKLTDLMKEKNARKILKDYKPKK